MTEAEKLELAKAYVALSNAHELERIIPLFAPDAIYCSSNVGSFEGRAAIEAMMGTFFAKFPDVHWQAWNYHCVSPGVVHFEFEMSATDAESRERIRRPGVEEIAFAADGLIARLDVRAANPCRPAGTGANV